MYYSTMQGITWLSINCQQTTFERFSFHNRIRETSGPSKLTQRNIVNDVIRSACDPLIDESMLRRIQRCTEEDCRVLQNND